MSSRRQAGPAFGACLAVALAGCEATIGDAPLGSKDAAGGRAADAAPSIADAAATTPDASGPDAAAPDAAPAAPDARPPCDGGDDQIEGPDGHCYELYGLSGGGDALWQQARDACEDVGAHLAAITSDQEDDIVLALVGAHADERPDYWLGGFQDNPSADDEPDGAWEWVTGESIVIGDDYVGWRDGEPNDGSGGGEDCMIIEADVGGTWDDRDCDAEPYPFVCERE